MEVTVTEYVKVQPMALDCPKQITDPSVNEEIVQLARYSKTPAGYMVVTLAGGLETLAAMCHSKQISYIVRRY